MLLTELKKEVLEANLELVRQGLVVSTFGNASAISREQNLVVIKPSGVPYSDLAPGDLVVTDLEGKTVGGSLRPSSDLATHLVLYKTFPQVGGVVHTHSRYATSWAQAGREIPCLGTTHADYFYGSVPITAEMQPEEIEESYEQKTGEVIVRRIQALEPESACGVLVHSHGPFCWGASVKEAVEHAVILEEIARMALYTLTLNPTAKAISQPLLDKHFLRKHGSSAYYGQKK